MAEYYSDNRPELIHCEYCGEDYAATYRACPFCDTAPSGRKVRSRSSAPKSRGGSRVRTNTRGGGYGGAKSPLAIIGIILAVALVIAAVIIIGVLVKSAVDGMGDNSSQGGTSSAITSGDSSGATSEDEGNSSGEIGGPIAPDGLMLDNSTLTIYQGGTATLVATTNPINWIGQIIWSTSDSAVATVDQSGIVTYVGDGTCTITATAVGVTASCTVTCGGTPEPTESSILVNCYDYQSDDFTIRMSDGTMPFTATGGDGENYSWSIADASIAIVDPTTGKVTPVSPGKTTLTVTSGGETTTVILRVRE